MLNKRHNHTDPERSGSFRVEGRIKREQPDCQPEELQLSAYLFDKGGMLLGRADINQNGDYQIEARLSAPVEVKLVVGPRDDDAQQIRHSSAFSQEFSAEDWVGKGGNFRLRYDRLLPLYVWKPWFSKRLCVSGHVRKVSQTDGGQEICPVPYLKVEVFDVDREACWWPWLRKWWEDLVDRPVIRIPDLLQEPPFPPRPFPGPDPAPELTPELNLNKITSRSVNAGRSPLEALFLKQRQFSAEALTGPRSAAINPQPEPPGLGASPPVFTRVGESRLMDASLAARFDKLTLTSRTAPWHILPGCFYSKKLVCETTTDCNGYFNCCFHWWPLQFRQGRLRFDSRPDIIIKVTQIINGVANVIYMDPYTSTRWNVTNAHIDLFLDDEEVVCGNGHCYQSASGSPVFFTRIGDDEVYQIDQTTGLYNEASLKNVAYGHTLYIYGQFGDMLTASDADHGDPPPYFYYRLSYARRGSSDDEFKFIDVNLNDTRVNKASMSGHSHKLGPYNVNGVPCLYEVRNFNDYYWYNPDWIGIWHSWIAERDTGEYILRLEVFDRSGNKLNSSAGIVDYRNGAGLGNGIPPSPLPSMTDHCDLLITLDNKRPRAELTVPAAPKECGVVTWSAGMSLDIQVKVSQENNRLHEWQLWYTKGAGVELRSPYGSISNNGLPGSVSVTVPGATLLGLGSLDTTCAFALRLRAWAHVRNGRRFIYYDQDISAIAIEKCPPCFCTEEL